MVVGLMLDLAKTAWDIVWARANPDATQYASIRAISHFAFGLGSAALNAAIANQLYNIVTYPNQRILFHDMLTIIGHCIRYGTSANWDVAGGMTTGFGGQIANAAGTPIAVWAWGTTVRIVAQKLGVELPPAGSFCMDGVVQFNNPDGSIQIGCAARYILQVMPFFVIESNFYLE